MDIRRKHRSDCEHIYLICTSRVLSPDRTWPDRSLSEMHESRRVGLGTTVEYIERKFKTKAFWTFPGVFHDMALQGLCLDLSFNVLYCRTQANPPTLMKKEMRVHTRFSRTSNIFRVRRVIVHMPYLQSRNVR